MLYGLLIVAAGAVASVISVRMGDADVTGGVTVILFGLWVIRDSIHSKKNMQNNG